MESAYICLGPVLLDFFAQIAIFLKIVIFFNSEATQQNGYNIWKKQENFE